jgi:hypothetical protein
MVAKNRSRVLHFFLEQSDCVQPHEAIYKPCDASNARRCGFQLTFDHQGADVRDFAGRRVSDIQRAVNSQGTVARRRISIDRRSRREQCTAPIADAALQVAPLLIVFPKEAINLGGA